MEIPIGIKIGFPYYFQRRSIYYFHSEDLEKKFQCLYECLCVLARYLKISNVLTRKFVGLMDIDIEIDILR
jgi:hypothetical protein